MTRSTRKFRVFEFDEEEEDRVEKESAKFVGKFRIQKRKRNDNKKDDDASSPLTKYNFLQCFGGCTGTVKIERSNEPIDIDDGPIDVDTGGGMASLRKGKSDEVVYIDTTIIDDQCQYSVSVSARMPQEDCAVKEEISQIETFITDDGPIDVDTGVAGEINTLCKGKSDEVVDIDTIVLDDHCQCSVSVPARMPQEDCAVKEEISQLDTLGIDIDDGPIDVDTGVAGEINTLCKGKSDEVVDIDTTVLDDQCQCSVSVPARMPQEDCAVKEEISQLDTLGIDIDDEPIDVATGVPTCMPQKDCADNEISQLDTLRLSSFPNYESELVGMISDNDVSIEMSSSTSVSTPSDDEVPLGNQVLECGSLGHKIDYTNYTVAVFPDYILCSDIYGTESCLTFSGSSIRMEGSTANGVKGIFNAEWNLDDLISIESEWCEMVTTAMVYLCLKSKVSEGAGNTNDASDVDKLKFSVYDPHWHEGEEAIKSLNARYKDIWNVTSESDLEKDGNASFGHNGMFTSKPYFPVIHETFEEVIYPKGDPDAVSISKRDVELLHPETFINDTIIDFYIQYLRNKIQPDDRQRFHFFNSFFFRKLADLDKGPSNACEGRIAFQRVRKWTRKLNIFEKDYIFIPVNYSLHWSLIVICHPGEVVHSREDESGNSRKVPCILHMDSIRGSHKGLKNLIQSYLYEEWRERHNETVDDTLSKFLHLRFVALELPQQENLYDCGLFLLHYVELFLEEAPIDFSPLKITEFSNFLSRNWFIPGEASLKRTHIQKLICEIIEDQSCTQSSDPNEQETGVEFLEEVCSAVSGPDTDMEIQISLTAKSPISGAQQRRLEELGLNSRDLLKPGTSARFFSNGNCWQTGTLHWRTCMSPVEEAEETGERICDSLSDTEDDQLPAGLAMEFPSTSLSLKDHRSLGSSRNKKYMQLEEPYDDSSSEASTSRSPKSSEIGVVGVDEDRLHSQFEGLDHKKHTDCYELSSKSTEPEEFVEHSQEGNCMHNDHVTNDSPSSFHNTGNCNKLGASVGRMNTAENFLRGVQKPVIDLTSDEHVAERTKHTSDGI
ncbi:probable ubiquitin-like-specific protease 2B isoform X2 [Populus nigra]|uniref:probable ubiquitin-like-specific protease 2B isoform X2 n=1 Tax=Populus nigra TaxID=3691 RepID=UPI002B26F80B|nr:probable ubiquitin-like-specific protease 2B isoform X2 [Populus nigra]